MRSFWLFAVVPVIILIVMIEYIVPWVNTMDSVWYKALPDTSCHNKYGSYTCKDISWSNLSLVDKVSVRTYGEFKHWVMLFIIIWFVVFLWKLTDINSNWWIKEEKENKKYTRRNKWTLKSEFGIKDETNQKEKSTDKDDEKEDVELRGFTEWNIL